MLPLHAPGQRQQEQRRQADARVQVELAVRRGLAPGKPSLHGRRVFLLLQWLLLLLLLGVCRAALQQLLLQKLD